MSDAIEALTIRLETKTFESFDDHSGDGRTLSEVEWKKLRTDVGKLKGDLDLVEVGSEIPESPPSIA